MTLDVYLKCDNFIKKLNLENVTHFALSDVNNTIYTYTEERKIKDIYTRNYVYLIANRENIIDDITNDSYLNIYEILLPDDTSIYLKACKYDHNTYTGEVKFIIQDNNKPILIGIANMNNILGIRKVY